MTDLAGTKCGEVGVAAVRDGDARVAQQQACATVIVTEGSNQHTAKAHIPESASLVPSRNPCLDADPFNLDKLLPVGRRYVSQRHSGLLTEGRRPKVRHGVTDDLVDGRVGGTFDGEEVRRGGDLASREEVRRRGGVGARDELNRPRHQSQRKEVRRDHVGSR